MLGLPGSGFLENRLLGAGTLSTFEQVTGLLGLNAGNAPVLLSLGDVQFSLNTAALQQVSRNTESTWAEIPRIGHLNSLQYTGPGADTWTIPCDLYPDWKGSEDVIDTLRMMARSGGVYFLMGANGDVIGLFIVRSVTEEQSLYKASGDPRKYSFTLTLQRYAETAGQKASARKSQGMFGSVGRFVGTLEGDVSSAIGSVEGAVGDAVGSVLDPISKELKL
ncbi:phage tail protein [Bombella pollinis]|uniref:Phage tail protein n=1 Tax=Bombella pollinis TaxID=2967337 RepID=A0ABT3WMP9_9PROT|nr:phage tail protein [Bombella pollinis]MCX5619923.1 phage tail protein [Bombella pollinis]